MLFGCFSPSHTIQTICSSTDAMSFVLPEIPALPLLQGSGILPPLQQQSVGQATGPATKKKSFPPLKLRDEEMDIVMQWTDSFRAAKNKLARMVLLGERILPLLHNVNTTLMDAAWKQRWSVSIDHN